MSCCAVIDTNVLVSALLSSKDDAATVQVMGKVLDGEITPIYSRVIAKEYREVLSRRKFGFSAELIEYFISAIEKYGIPVEPSSSVITLPDMKDVPFYAAVLAMRDAGAYLITGNIRHFPEEPYVVTARQMLDIIQEQSGQ